MHQRERALTVTFVLSLVNVFNNQNVVFHLERVSVKFLATHVANTYIQVVA